MKRSSVSAAHQRDASACGGHCINDLISESLWGEILAPIDGVQEVWAEQPALLQLADQLNDVALREAHLQDQPSAGCQAMSQHTDGLRKGGGGG